VSQRVSRPLVRAVVLVLRSGLATFAAADIESRSPHVIRRRHYRIPRIVHEVADPFLQVLKVWHHFHFGLLGMQWVLASTCSMTTCDG